MLLAIALMLIGWWCWRHARALEQRVADGVPSPCLELVIEVRDRTVREGLAGRNGGGELL